MQIGDRIRFAREQAGLTQTELAVRCGIRHNTISQLESGKTTAPSSKTLLRMADALGRTPDWLAGDGESSSSAVQLSTEEETLVAAFRALSAQERKFAHKVVRLLAAASEP